MFRLSLICLLMGIGVSMVRAENIDVFLFAGQSNASGRVSTGYVADPRDAQVRYYYRTDGPADQDVNSGAFATLKPLTTGYYGPEITMGRALIDQGYNPAIIKVSDGGTSLASHWNSRTNGTWWNNWKSTVATSLAQLINAGHTVNIRGFFWLQGETDAGNQASANNYQSNFQNLTSDVKAFLNSLGHDASDMAYVTALIHNPSGSAQYVPAVRDAQQAVMESLPLGGWFDTNDLTTPDNLHFNAAGVAAIGTRFAQTYSSVVPEPSCLMLALAGGTILTRRRRCEAPGKT